MIMVDLESKGLVHPEREREMRNGVQTTPVRMWWSDPGQSIVLRVGQIVILNVGRSLQAVREVYCTM